MIKHSVYTYTTHDSIALDCDVYTHEDEADGTPEVPVLLFFHSGGLVAGSRACIPPWLVQTCYQRRWPLISPSYRFLPQTGANGLLGDAMAAYQFAKTYGASVTGRKRRVVVAGASAGFFLASLVAFYSECKPAALLSITGIPTFRHPFFSSSALLTPTPIQDSEVEEFIRGPTISGSMRPLSTAFSTDQLLPLSGDKNPEYVRPPIPNSTTNGTVTPSDGALDRRNCLYDYYLYNNAYPSLVGSVDPGLRWASSSLSSDSDNTTATITHKKETPLESWPKTIFIQGDKDEDVDIAVTTDTAEYLGPDKAEVFFAPGQGHLFEATSYLEDDSPGMDVVREAVRALEAKLVA